MKTRYLMLILYLLSVIVNVNCSDNNSVNDNFTPFSKQKLVKFYLDNQTKSSQKLDNNISFEDNNSFTEGNLHISMQEESNWDNEIKQLTRTTWGTTSTITTWVGGDAVGIYMRRATGVSDPNIDRSDIKYVATATGDPENLTTSVSPALYYPLLASDLVNFYAYYPYSWYPQLGETILSCVKFPTAASMNQMALNYTLPQDQTTVQTLTNCDLMYASARNLNNTSGAVSLNFNHALTLLTFRIRSNYFNGVNLSSVSLSGNRVTGSGTLDISATSPAVNTTSAPIFAPYSNVNKLLNKTAYTYVDFIINPCSVNGTSAQMALTLTVNGTNYTCAVPSNTFSAGRRRTITITVVN